VLLAAEIRAAAQRFGDATVMVAGDGTLTYHSLDSRSQRIAAGLLRSGVRAGDRIALRLPSGTSYLLAYAAAAKLGAAVAGINSGLASAEQNKLVELADPALVLDSVDAVLALEEHAGSAQVPDLPADPARLAALVFTTEPAGCHEQRCSPRHN
jgi:acyl-CoA synthetase (AMP-forming)/AMP-acid ligase II